MKFKRYSFLGVAVLLFALLCSGSPPQPEKTLAEIMLSLETKIADIHDQLITNFQDNKIDVMAGLLENAVVFAPDGKAKRGDAIKGFWEGVKGKKGKGLRFLPIKYELIPHEFTLDGDEYNYIAIVVCGFKYKVQSGEGENQDPEGSYVQVLLHRRQCDWP